ncbi:WhiB family transcriptional regulator [Nonomuraea sp. NPDC003804]|uniref:WhiB family transcriptional regulator n=1 Tax=Nonomuraea sp. NPDC003804 TaxID=3154547 RepID=UPI0033A261F9
MFADMMDDLTKAAAAEEWMSWGLCAETDPDRFFQPEQAGPRWWTAAVAVCEGCPVRVECLEYGLALGDAWGVWGGVTLAEGRTIER